MEALAIIFGFGGVVIGAVLTYFFTKSHYEQKRKDELADREFARRAAIYDMRIQEARDFIRDMEEALGTVSRFLSAILLFIVKDGDKSKDFEVLMADLNKSFQDYNSRVEVELPKASSLQVLGDKELLDLHKEIQAVVLSCVEKQFELVDKLDVDSRSDKSVPDDLSFMGHIIEHGYEILVRMKIRLDKLASEIK